MSTPRPPRSTPACPRTSGPARCGGRWTRRRPRRCGRERAPDGGETAGQLPVAAAGGDGRCRAVQRVRPGAAAGRAGHHAVVGAGVAAGHPDTGAAVAAGAGGAVRHLRRHPGAADRHPRRERPGPPPRRQQRRRQGRRGGPGRAATGSAPKKRTCARCGHHGWPGASFPEGHLCYPCLDVALSAAGTCPGCGTAGRALPGLRDGVRICRDCAGITRDFSCLRCGTETGMAPGSRRGLSRLCGRCAVAWTAARLLEDGTGAIAAPLKPLADALTATASPSATLEWLGKPHIRDLLTRLAAGTLPLTHEALDGWPRRRAVHYLRDLLVDCGALPAADRQLREFGTWLDRRLDALAGHPHLRLLRQFGLWHQLP